MEKEAAFVGTLNVHVMEAQLPIAKKEFMGYEKFFPYYSLSLINEQGEAKEPPGVFDSKTSKDRRGVAHFTSPPWVVNFPVPGATRLRVELYSEHIVSSDKCLQFFDFSLQKLLKGSHVRSEKIYSIGIADPASSYGRASDDNYLEEVVHIKDRQETRIKVRVTWEGSELIDQAVESIHNKEVLPLSQVKTLFASFSSHMKGGSRYFTDPEELWKFLDRNDLLKGNFDMFLSEESLFSQTQKVLMQSLEPGGSGRPLRASMLFNLCDLNHDEKVEFKEVIMLLAACSDATGAERLELAFSVLDADHSGNLSYKEVLVLQQWNFMFLFRVALQYILLKASNGPEIPNMEDQVEGWWKELLLQKQYPNDIAHVIMDLADKDQNGSISRAEYSAFMRDPGSQEVILGTVRSYLVEIKQVFDFRLETLQNRE